MYFLQRLVLSLDVSVLKQTELPGSIVGLKLFLSVPAPCRAGHTVFGSDSTQDSFITLKIAFFLLYK